MGSPGGVGGSTGGSSGGNSAGGGSDSTGGGSSGAGGSSGSGGAGSSSGGGGSDTAGGSGSSGSQGNGYGGGLGARGSGPSGNGDSANGGSTPAGQDPAGSFAGAMSNAAANQNTANTPNNSGLGAQVGLEAFGGLGPNVGPQQADPEDQQAENNRNAANVGQPASAVAEERSVLGTIGAVAMGIGRGALSGAAIGARTTAVPAGVISQLDSPAPGPADVAALGTLAVGTAVGAVGYGLYGGYQALTNPSASAPMMNENQDADAKPGFTGEPGSSATVNNPDGTPKQTRTYGEDGYPESDIDYNHDHGQGQPHVHDWGRPENGDPPTHKDRGPGRAPRADEAQ